MRYTQVGVLEHILPQKPNATWTSKFTKTDPDLYTWRLGNMTLLDASINRKVGNGSFTDKCSKAYSRSQLEITKKILEYSVWGPKQIEERQSEMSKVACHIWRLDY
ncbi:MAG: HNH endonuclease [Symploca sp. SIO1A3]|nr:HNH endonuclease [Symploca sp. SIO1A3]